MIHNDHEEFTGMEISGTRGEILNIIKRQGQATIPELAKKLGIAPNAVRGHMAILEKVDLVTFQWEKQKRGRTIKIYKLSERAEGKFPKRYDHLIEELIIELAAQDGPEKLQKLVRSMARRWAGGLEEQLEGLPPEKALHKIVKHLDLGGMIASLKNEEGYYSLSVFNCVYRQTAMRHREICTIIPTLIHELTGDDVMVERSIHSGYGHCIYHIMPKE